MTTDEGTEGCQGRGIDDRLVPETRLGQVREGAHSRRDLPEQSSMIAWTADREQQACNPRIDSTVLILAGTAQPGGRRADLSSFQKRQPDLPVKSALSALQLVDGDASRLRKPGVVESAGLETRSRVRVRSRWRRLDPENPPHHGGDRIDARSYPAGGRLPTFGSNPRCGTEPRREKDRLTRARMSHLDDEGPSASRLGESIDDPPESGGGLLRGSIDHEAHQEIRTVAGVRLQQLQREIVADLASSPHEVRQPGLGTDLPRQGRPGALVTCRRDRGPRGPGEAFGVGSGEPLRVMGPSDHRGRQTRSNRVGPDHRHPPVLGHRSCEGESVGMRLDTADHRVTLDPASRRDGGSQPGEPGVRGPGETPKSGRGAFRGIERPDPQDQEYRRPVA